MKITDLIKITVFAVFALSGCSSFQQADVYTVSVDPYRPLSDEDIRFGECTIQFDDGVSVNGQGAWYGEDGIIISKGGIYTISGSCSDCCISVTTDDAVKLVFANAEITNPDGYAVTSSAEKLIIASDGVSSVTGCGGEYQNAILSDGALLLAGSGNMSINGGVISRGGIDFGRNVTTFCEIVTTDEGEIINGTLLLK